MSSRDPFLIEGPACISFSGGRSSGYMLWRILQSHGGVLPPDVHVVFANTGKEELATLDFVHECSVRWNVPVTWLEFKRAEKTDDRWKVVTYETASRNGEPFDAVIEQKNFLPNPVTRYCTSEMKVKAMHRYMHIGLGYEHWTSVVGIRGDEPRRLARIAVPNRDRDERYAPLGVAGVTAAEVGRFWATHEFDLRLPNMNGKTLHGNCDLCYLKGGRTVLALIREKPERALWWMQQEKRIEASTGAVGEAKARFRNDRPTYHQLYAMATQHGELFAFDAAFDENEESLDCNCTD